MTDESTERLWRSTLGPALEDIAKRHGGLRPLSERIDVKYDTLLAWMKGRNPPRLYAVMDMITELGLADMNDVLLRIVTGRAPDSEVVEVNVYNARLAAGDGAFNERADVVDTVPFQLTDLQRYASHGDPERLGILEINGDSMTPTIKASDRVMIDFAANRRGDGIYAYELFGQARVKRFQFNHDGLHIVSDNAEYGAPERLTFEQTADLHIIGPVVWRAGRP